MVGTEFCAREYRLLGCVVLVTLIAVTELGDSVVFDETSGLYGAMADLAVSRIIEAFILRSGVLRPVLCMWL